MTQNFVFTFKAIRSFYEFVCDLFTLYDHWADVNQLKTIFAKFNFIRLYHSSLSLNYDNQDDQF